MKPYTHSAGTSRSLTRRFVVLQKCTSGASLHIWRPLWPAWEVIEWVRQSATSQSVGLVDRTGQTSYRSTDLCGAVLMHVRFLTEEFPI